MGSWAVAQVKRFGGLTKSTKTPGGRVEAADLDLCIFPQPPHPAAPTHARDSKPEYTVIYIYIYLGTARIVREHCQAGLAVKHCVSQACTTSPSHNILYRILLSTVVHRGIVSPNPKHYPRSPKYTWLLFTPPPPPPSKSLTFSSRNMKLEEPQNSQSAKVVAKSHLDLYTRTSNSVRKRA